MTDAAADAIALARQPGRFDADTAIEPLPGGGVRARIDPRWSVGRGPNGGYLAAIVLRALIAAVEDPQRSPLSLTLHFVSPPEMGGVLDVVPTVERRGGLLTSLSVRAHQADRLVALGLAAFSQPRPGGPEFSELRMPDVPGPAGAEPLAFDPRSFMPPPIAACWDTRHVGGRPFSGSDRAEITAWARLPEGRPWDPLSVAALADGVIPAITPRMRPEPHAFPTIDLTIHFRRPIPPDLGGEVRLLGHFRTRLATGGYFEEDGEVWAPDGSLLAQSRQIMVVLSRRD